METDLLYLISEFQIRDYIIWSIGILSVIRFIFILFNVYKNFRQISKRRWILLSIEGIIIALFFWTFLSGFDQRVQTFFEPSIQVKVTQQPFIMSPVKDTVEFNFININ